MQRFVRGVYFAVLLAIGLASGAQAQLPPAQGALNWGEVKQRFEANNPTLRAGAIGIDESRAEEITAYLRPNPNFAITVDGTQIAPNKGVWRPFAGTYEVPAVSYLHERRHKRELRLQSAKEATAITISGQADLERGLLFALRSAFVGTLQAKADLEVVKSNLAYWDTVLKISKDRLDAGDLAQIDYDRLELQRVQFESDVQTAEVNLRTAKIILLMLLNDRTPVDQLDVTGPFDYNDQLESLDDFHQTALQNRPDLKAAVQAVDKAKTDHQLAVANGSTDPTLGAWYTHNASTNNPFGNQTLGLSVGIPLRIKGRNCAPSWISGATKSCWTRREPACSATWIRPTPWSTAT